MKLIVAVAMAMASVLGLDSVNQCSVLKISENTSLKVLRICKKYYIDFVPIYN